MGQNQRTYKYYKNKNNHVYQQVFGMPMGNPLSPTIADIILDNLLDSAIEILKTKNINIKFIVKYVDDFLAIVKSNEVEEILKTLNSYHDKLQFTVEQEEDRSIPYLDMKIYSKNNEIITNWYCKPTASGRIINYHSTQPHNQKINTAYNLINKVLTISHEQFTIENIQKLKTILKNNDYPLYIIKNLIEKQKLQKLKNKTADLKNNEKNFYSIRFVPTLTDNKTLGETITKNDNATFAYKTNQSLRSIFSKTKDKLKREEQHDAVYQIHCKGNDQEKCKQSYIGTTKRAVSTRVKEHETDIAKQKYSTALSQHMIDNKHEADFENIKILDIERRESTRYTLEALRIQQNIHETMNIKEDTDNICSSYLVALWH